MQPDLHLVAAKLDAAERALDASLGAGGPAWATVDSRRAALDLLRAARSDLADVARKTEGRTVVPISPSRAVKMAFPGEDRSMWCSIVAVILGDEHHQEQHRIVVLDHLGFPSIENPLSTISSDTPPWRPPGES